MRLAGARAAAFCARPDGRARGALLHGTDPSQVALRRQELVRAATGGDDLRLTRLDAARAARDRSEIDAALRARGFFGERSVVLIEDAGEALARPLGDVLGGSTPEDAFLVVTAGSLPKRSGLRNLFETGDGLVALAFHGGPLAPGELDDALAGAGLSQALTSDAVAGLAEAAQAMDRGAMLQLIEKIAVYMLGRAAPIDAPELAALLPEAVETQLDRLVAAVAEGHAEAVGPLIRRVLASGVGPVTILIAAGRHFRLLLGLASAPDGIGAALGRIRPPVFGPRREAMAAQARAWDRRKLEAAARVLFQADRRLRSPGDRPDAALVERCLIRLAMMAGRG